MNKFLKASPTTPSILFLAGLLIVLCSTSHADEPANLPGNVPHQAAQKQREPDEAPLSEDDIRKRLQGKALYLRGGYSDNSLRFNNAGILEGGSAKDSYTLSLIEIDKVHVEKHKILIQGIRYGIHFLDRPSSDDPLAAGDKLRITPKKKFVSIVIDRDRVSPIKAPKEKPTKSKKGGSVPPPAVKEPAVDVPFLAPGVAATHAQANQDLRAALDHIFAPGLDEKMMASLPECWSLYFKAADAKQEFHPSDPAVLRQSAVDQKARLLTSFAPPSSDLAQAAGVTGMAEYHVVVTAAGKPTQVVVSRPIGFGLDEKTAAEIQKASFQPAIKGGQPVPVMLDLVVQFRIFSKRTGSTTQEAVKTDAAQPAATPLPGPYSVNLPQPKPQ